MGKTSFEDNIKILEQGITLQQYAEMEEELEPDVYHQYGFYVIHNKTKNLYLLDGGEQGFTMRQAIHVCFFRENGRGSKYMHQNYADGDEMILKYYRFDPQKYHDMNEMRATLTKYYDSFAESYRDYDNRMYKERRKNLNGTKRAQVRNESLPAKLLRLEHNHKIIYGLLNALFDVLIKALPIFAYLLYKGGYIFGWGPIIPKALGPVQYITATYLLSILGYIALLLFVAIFKMLFGIYPLVNIHIRIFNIIIRLGQNKLYTDEDYKFMSEHEGIIEARENNIRIAKDKAYQIKRKFDEKDLNSMKKDLKYRKEAADSYYEHAMDHYEDARRGDSFFFTAEEKKEMGDSALKTAEFHEWQADYDKKRIAKLERKLRKKS